MLKRNGILATVFLSSASLISGKVNKPNIILILADDLAPAYLGCYGGIAPTPEIDRLAAEGVKFTNAYANSALSNPSRYTLLTGQYAGRNPNVYANVPENEPYFINQNTRWTSADPSIAKALKNAGYYTGFVGKWHSNFEDLEGGEKLPEGLDMDNPETTKMLQDLQVKHIKSIKEISGFDYVGSLQVGNLDGKKKNNPFLGCHNPEWITQGALDYIERATKTGKPFFLHLANSVPHTPDVLESLENGDTRYTVAGKLDKALNCHPSRETVKQRLKEAGLNTKGPIGSINAGAIVLDDQLKALRTILEQKGIAKNTMIIWVADHSIYGKGTVYASGNKVPLIIHWPQSIKSGTVITTAVSLVDLFKTCMAAAEAEIPVQKIDGINLLPVIDGINTAETVVYQETNWFRGIVKGKYHYVAFRPTSEAIAKMKNGEVNFAVDNPEATSRSIFGDLNLPFKPAYFDADQLYDIEVDPLERNNLAYHPAYSKILAEMKKELIKFTGTFSRPFPQDVNDYLNSEAYAKQVKERKKMAVQQKHYPEGYDCERIFNNNLLDPLAD